jgi:hypothetical protein
VSLVWSVAPFVCCGAAWLLGAVTIAARLAGAGWARRSTLAMSSQCVALVMMSAMLLSLFASDRDWPRAARSPIDLADIVIAAVFLVIVLRDASRRSRSGAGDRGT